LSACGHHPAYHDPRPTAHLCQPLCGSGHAPKDAPGNPGAPEYRSHHAVLRAGRRRDQGRRAARRWHRRADATTEESMSNLKELSYHIAPEDQGQFVEYAFAYDWENGRVIQRVTDRSGARTYYYAAPAENLIGEWEPWNRAPQFARG